MRLLALDAALGPCSVALIEDGRCLGVKAGADSRAATATLPVMVQDLLREHGAGFDAVAVTVGPGSFTGLRGAIALANGLAIGAGVPVVGVTVAEALLDGLSTSRQAWVALDSRRAGRIFLGRDGAMEAAPMAALPLPAGPAVVLGDAAGAVVAALQAAGADAVSGNRCQVSLASVARVALRRLAGDLAACPAQPLYIEPPEARPAAAHRPAPA